MITDDSVKNEFDMLDLFERTPDLVCIASKEGYFKMVNPAVSQKLGYSQEELFSRPIAFNIHEDDRELTRRTRNEMLDGKALVNFQNRYVCKDGSVVWLQWTSVFLPGKDIVFAIAKDITESKIKEQEIEKKYNAYRVMAVDFKNRAEENRKYLAHELYEEVAQLAAVIKMNIAWMNQHIITDSELAKKRMQEAQQVSDLLIKSVRRVSFSLSPKMLEDLDFDATMKCQSSEFALLNGIPCTFESSGSDNIIPRDIQIDLFRISQESLHNIMKYAEATQVKILLRKEKDYISFSIIDNGKGFNIDKHGNSAGLQYMKQLAASINGILTIESKSGEGTVVMVTIKKTKDAE